MNIIPRPNKICYAQDEQGYTLHEGDGVWFAPALAACADAFQTLIAQKTGIAFQNVDKSAAKICFCEQKTLAKESYHLTATQSGIEIAAPDAAGAFYAVQSLRLLLSADLSCVPYVCPAVHIEDAPAFAWRGLHIDTARHFFDKDEIIKIMRFMALCKLNVLHLHLTDDQGFRIPITKYPEINRVSTTRAGTQGPAFLKRKVQPGVYAAQFTREDIAEIVAFGKENHIKIVPELDIPGHCAALVAAMPHLSCTGDAIAVRERFGISPDILCAGNDEVYAVIQAIIDEIIALFGCEYLHLGGDEAPKKRWKACPKCQAKIRALGLADEHALQAHMFNTLAAYAQEKGVRVLGWNECLNPHLNKSVINQHWIGNPDKKTLPQLNAGRDTVFSYFSYYFDYPYSMTPLEKTYAQPIAPNGTTEAGKAHILGVEGCLWSEFMCRREKLEFNLFPRLFALAERAWTQDSDYDTLIDSMNGYRPLLEAEDICYANMAFTHERHKKAPGKTLTYFCKNAYAEFESETGISPR